MERIFKVIIKYKANTVLTTRQVSIHTIYWIVILSLFLYFYTIIGPLRLGIRYSFLSLPLMIGITYLFIYWSIPKFLFKRKYLLFGLISTAIFLVILNLQILFITFNHLFISDYLNEMVELVHWEFFYLIIANTIFPLPFIVYESIRFWNKTRSEVEELAEHVDQSNYIEIKSNGKKQLIDSNTIIYIESFKDHAHIHLSDQKIVTRMTLKRINELLPEFLRTHRSYMVNPKFCQAFNLDEVILGDKKVPVGRTYKDEVSVALKSANKLKI